MASIEASDSVARRKVDDGVDGREVAPVGLEMVLVWRSRGNT
jgi:hypothetical protein